MVTEQGSNFTIAAMAKAIEYKRLWNHADEYRARLDVKLRDLYNTMIRRKCWDPTCHKDGIFQLHDAQTPGAPGHYSCDEHAIQLLSRQKKSPFPCPLCRHMIPTQLQLDRPGMGIHNWLVTVGDLSTPNGFPVDLTEFTRAIYWEMSRTFPDTHNLMLNIKLPMTANGATPAACDAVREALRDSGFEDTHFRQPRYGVVDGQLLAPVPTILPHIVPLDAEHARLEQPPPRPLPIPSASPSYEWPLPGYIPPTSPSHDPIDLESFV